MKTTFLPLDEVVYLKLYMNAALMNRFIAGPLSQLVSTINTKCSKWHYIRYADPYPHLRVRVWRSGGYNMEAIVRNVVENLQPFVYRGAIKNVEYGTYTREVERYGADSIEAAEECFYRDSCIISNLLAHTEFNIDNEWLYALKLFDEVLQVWAGEKFANKAIFLEQNFNAYGHNSQLIRSVELIGDNLHHSQRNRIQAMLDVKSPLASVFICSDTDDRCRVYQDYFARVSKQASEAFVSGLYADLTHMVANRLFQTRNLYQELVVQRVLYKHSHSMAIQEHMDDISAA